MTVDPDKRCAAVIAARTLELAIAGARQRGVIDDGEFGTSLEDAAGALADAIAELGRPSN